MINKSPPGKDFVVYFSDGIGVMYQVRLVELASAAEIISNSCHPYTRKLFSSVPGKQMAIAEVDEEERPSIACNQAAMSTACCNHADACPIGDRNCEEAAPVLTEIKKGHQVTCLKA